MNARALAVALLSIPIWGYAQKSDEHAIVWQSRNSTFQELTKEFADLYGNLISLRAKGRAIPTTTVRVPAGTVIADVLRERHLYDGKYLPKQLDVLVCQMNRDVCTVQAGRSGSVAGNDASAIWKIQPDQTIVVPDIDFESIIVHKPYQKSPGDTLKSIVVDDRQGCDSFDDACRKYVQNLNRRLPEALDTGYGGKITVPTKAYRAVIPVTGTAPAVSQETSRDIVKMVPAMSEQLVPPSKAILHDASSASTPEGSRALVLKLIRHPFAKAEPGMLQPHRTPNVAVFDSWVDKGHCMLSNVTVLDPDGLAAAVERAPTCGDRGSATDAQDHGTHVVGLIGTRLGLDASLGPGIDPYASIKVVSINTDSFKLPLYLAKQSDRLRDLYRTDAPDVVNMSFEYTLSAEAGRNDVFHAAMKDQERDTLFVVSAGNDGTELSASGECRVRPACYDDMNVVTVGALDLSDDAPAMMNSLGRLSNFGGRVHLAAPGQNIVSTIAGDRSGVMSGTSQAAPAVAGAASLLYLYEHRLLPSQVKNRLIYTCDLFPSLYTKLRGGRLNVQRLLAYDRAIVDIVGDRHVEGSVRDQTAQVRFVDFDTNELVPLRFVQIRRLMLNAGLGYYTLFYNDDVGRDTGLLKRRFVTIKDTNAKVSFGVSTGAGGPEKREEVNIRDIVDYVSPLLL